MERMDATDVVLLSLDGENIVACVKSATFSEEFDHADAGGIRDGYKFPVVTGASWSLDLDATIESLPMLATKVAAGDFTYTVIFNTGAGIYNGTAVIKNASHGIERQDLQSRKVSLAGHGPYTFSAI